ncbi:ABC transporter permease [Glutamicibacter sp. 287]|uniref:ABC transporter permease n=1 Tax=unclassified Glutamicibacter TaxID=2627139 RepID=UPI000BB84452|nr:ABC transporter permease [Glutamicibacter sp. BW80]PCC29010.1 ABC transporter permease [Glutamicibacter sp. BW80]
MTRRLGPPGGQRLRVRTASGILVRRLLLALPVTAGITALVFWLASVAPFNPLANYLGSRYVRTDAAQREALNEQLGLDNPWFLMWWRWAVDAVQGNWGFSRLYAQPVREVLLERLPYTALLALAGLLLAVVASLLLAWLAARHRGGVLDRAAVLFAQCAQALPPFVLALIAIAIFALGLGMPAGGASSSGAAPTAGTVLVHLILPAMVLAVSLLPWLLLNLRSSMFEVLESDAVLAARGRGVSEAQILRHEVLPVAALPFLTVVGSRLGELVTGALLVESVFAWPGIASAVIDAAVAGDFALLAAVTACSCLMVFAGNALADAGYVLADPRVRDV